MIGSAADSDGRDVHATRLVLRIGLWLLHSQRYRHSDAG